MATKSLALELAPHVRVNAIAPGAILWPEDDSGDERRAALLARTPLARTGTPAEVAEAVRWLLRDATYCTGPVLRLDGGRLLAEAGATPPPGVRPEERRGGQGGVRKWRSRG